MRWINILEENRDAFMAINPRLATAVESHRKRGSMSERRIQELTPLTQGPEEQLNPILADSPTRLPPFKEEGDLNKEDAGEGKDNPQTNPRTS